MFHFKIEDLQPLFFSKEALEPKEAVLGWHTIEMALFSTEQKTLVDEMHRENLVPTGKVYGF